MKSFENRGNVMIIGDFGDQTEDDINEIKDDLFVVNYNNQIQNGSVE